jgi:hypothetical protein
LDDRWEIGGDGGLNVVLENDGAMIGCREVKEDCSAARTWWEKELLREYLCVDFQISVSSEP